MPSHQPDFDRAVEAALFPSPPSTVSSSPIGDAFPCPVALCTKSFERRYNLSVHMRRHTGETPYTCQVPSCTKKFKWRSSMAHHNKTHEKLGHIAARMPIIQDKNLALHRKRPAPPTRRPPQPGTPVTHRPRKRARTDHTSALPVPPALFKAEKVLLSPSPPSPFSTPSAHTSAHTSVHTSATITSPPRLLAFSPATTALATGDALPPLPSPASFLLPHHILPDFSPKPAQSDSDEILGIMGAAAPGLGLAIDAFGFGATAEMGLWDGPL